jgi:hypothetical protein
MLIYYLLDDTPTTRCDLGLVGHLIQAIGRGREEKNIMIEHLKGVEYDL